MYLQRWTKLERLDTRLSRLQRRLTKAAEHGDHGEFSFLQDEIASALKRRGDVLSRLRDDGDAAPKPGAPLDPRSS